MLEEPEEEGVLTAERVLRHAQAQGLQPVVDVRFSHRHLELCKETGTGDPGQGTRWGPCPVPQRALTGLGNALGLGFSNPSQDPPASQGHWIWRFAFRCNNLRQEEFAKTVTSPPYLLARRCNLVSQQQTDGHEGWGGCC